MNDPLRAIGIVREVVLRAAKWYGAQRVAVIGSAAVFGSLPDVSIASAIGTGDIDTFPLDAPLSQEMYISSHAELGFESDLHEELGVYVDTVPPHVPPLPVSWLARSIEQPAGLLEIDGRMVAITAVFPDIHDLVASKLAVGRANDVHFLTELIHENALDEATLRARLGEIAGREPAVARALRNVGRAFGRDPSAYEVR